MNPFNLGLKLRVREIKDLIHGGCDARGIHESGFEDVYTE